MPNMHRHELMAALRHLGGVLEDRDLQFNIAIVGGAAVLFHGYHDRVTQDVDVVGTATGSERPRPGAPIPTALSEAAQDVAETWDFPRDWLNAGALGLLGGHMPDGYVERLEPHVMGGLTVWVVHRTDLVKLKLYAAADEGPGSVHLEDLRLMDVAEAELDEAARWVESLYPPGPLPELCDVLQLLGSQR